MTLGCELKAQSTYNSEYTRVMNTVTKWESTPDSLISVAYKRSFNGRKARLKMIYTEKVPVQGGFRYRTYLKKYRLKHKKKGTIETTRIYANSVKVGYIKKINGNYFLVESYSDVIILDKIVITRIGSQRNTYFK